MITPTLQVCADKKSKIAGSAPIFNKSEVTKTLHVHLPMDPYNLGDLHEICEITSASAKYTPIDAESYKLFTAHPWIDIETSALNLIAGYHKYRLLYNNKEFESDIVLYFAYTIQDDCPNKPYIYMVDIDEETDSSEDSDSSGTEDTDTEID